MSADLRPMNLGEILDRTLQLYRSRFWAFAAIATIPALIVRGVAVADANWFHLFSMATSDNDSKPSLILIQAVFAIGYFHFASFFGMLVSPAIIKPSSGAILDQEISFRESLRFLAHRWRSYLWLSTLQFAGELVLPEMLAFWLLVGIMELGDVFRPMQFLQGSPSLGIAALFSLSGFVLFLWVSASLSLAFPAAAFEGLKGFRALRRSWTLSRGSRLRIAFAWLSIAIASWAARSAILVLLQIFAVAVVHATHSRLINHTLYLIAYQTLKTVLATVFGPIYPIAITLFYYDQRIRREGFDIEWMMQRAGLTAPDLALPEAQPFPDLQQSPQPSPAPLEGSV